jgi:hypothetical protein
MKTVHFMIILLMVQIILGIMGHALWSMAVFFVMITIGLASSWIDAWLARLGRK